MRKSIGIIMGALLGAAILGVGGLQVQIFRGAAGIAIAEEPVLYHCPMHPQITSPEPGNCPICGMRLVKGTEHHDEMFGDRAGVEPPASSNQCSPDLGSGVKASAGCPTGAVHEPAPLSSSAAAPPAAHVHSAAPPERSVPGYAPVSLSAEEQATMGLQTAVARSRDLERTVQTVWRVTYNETALHHVHTKFEGYIEDLFVNFVGQSVKAGDPLYSIYAPDLFATEKEYVLALRAHQRSGAESDLLESAKHRLMLWDVGAEELSRLEKTMEPLKAMTVRSPVSGVVVEKTALHGMRITPADTVYDIANLATVWVIADIYEIDAPFVRVGQDAVVTLPYQPAKSWHAPISYVFPVVDEKTRTIKVRIELENRDGVLKPDMFAHVSFSSSLGRGLTVPESAVISTGERKIVFVRTDAGTFSPREVLTGVRLSGDWQIVSGLQDGETVAAGANFLLDSESKLRATLNASADEHHH